MLCPTDYWRAVILYGANSATYKLALATVLIDLAREGLSEISKQDLARHFFHAYRERVAGGQPQQSIPGRRTLLERVAEEHKTGLLTEAQAVDRVARQGFNDVIPRFHTVNGAPIPLAFYEATGTSLVLTDDLLALFSDDHDSMLPSEVESRWSLLEAAFSMHLPTETLGVDDGTIYRSRGSRRTTITGTRPVLHGYQNGNCFYCGEPLNDDVHVDHVIPRAVIGHDEIWNLVLAHSHCNLSKSDLLPSLEDVTRLHERNEYYIASNHPIRQHLIAQTGPTPVMRRSFLDRTYRTAEAQLIHVWHSPFATRPTVDPLRPLGLIAP